MITTPPAEAGIDEQYGPRTTPQQLDLSRWCWWAAEYPEYDWRPERISAPYGVVEPTVEYRCDTDKHRIRFSHHRYTTRQAALAEWEPEVERARNWRTTTDCGAGVVGGPRSTNHCGNMSYVDGIVQGHGIDETWVAGRYNPWLGRTTTGVHVAYLDGTRWASIDTDDLFEYGNPFIPMTALREAVKQLAAQVPSTLPAGAHRRDWDFGGSLYPAGGGKHPDTGEDANRASNKARAAARKVARTARQAVRRTRVLHYRHARPRRGWHTAGPATAAQIRATRWAGWRGMPPAGGVWIRYQDHCYRAPARNTRAFRPAACPTGVTWSRTR